MSDQTNIVEAPYEVAGAEDPKAAQATEESNGGSGVDAPAGEGTPAESQKETEAATDEGTKKPEGEEELIEQVSKATREEAEETLKQNGLDFGKFEQEYLANGSLSEESYAALEKAGIGKNYVDAYIKGNEAILQRFIGEVNDMAGGAEQYKAMTTWAESNLPKEEIDAYNSIMNSGNQPMIKIAVSGLISRYRDAEGVEPQIIKGKASSSSPAEGGSFASAEEMLKAMRDPRYGKDPVYTREVERKTGNSNFF